MARSSLVVGVTALLLVSGLAASGQAQNASPRLATACQLPDRVGEPSGTSLTDEGYYPYQEWRANTSGEASLEALGERLDSRFGKSTKADPQAQLRNGLIGVVIDDVAQKVIVVVDAAAVESDRLMDEIARDGDIRVDVRVHGGCNSSVELLAAYAVINSADFLAPDGNVPRAVVELNARDARWHVVLDNSSEMAASLRRKLGDLGVVTAVVSPVARHDRADDGEPHWGGAGIGPANASNNNICTSGFTVNTQSAGKAMVTAGHCFNNNNRIESGNEAYGEGRREHNYPAFDMILINGPNQNYNDDLYHNPITNEQNPIDVNGTRQPDVGDAVCVSGMATLARCGLDIRGTNAQLCDADGCTYGLIRYNKPGRACKGGDSGAPVYHRNSGGDRASIVGMHIGEVSNGCVAEKVSSIGIHFGVTVATTP